MSIRANATELLRANAQKFPDKPALRYPAGRASDGRVVYAMKTYAELDDEIARLAAGFRRTGIAHGTKTIVMVKSSPELFTVLFALLEIGSIPVVVDPGMGIERMLHCYESVGASAFVGIPIAHLVRVLRRRAFASLETWITVGKRMGWGGPTLTELAASPAAESRDNPAGQASDLALINFTTGSTGPARGVEYTHAMLGAMADSVVSCFELGPRAHTNRDVSLITLPLFAILDLLNGATAILAPMDPTQPARADAKKMLEALTELGVTHLFASPAFLHTLGEYAHANGLTLPATVKRVVSGGAPVTPALVQRFRRLLSRDAAMHATYGATEALPIASIESAEILGDTQDETAKGAGVCVGQPVNGLRARVITISETPHPLWSNALLAGPGEVGELVVSGPVVSASYHGAPAQNALHKIAEGDTLWHRTGDLARIDDRGRIWFCGRKSQRVVARAETLFTAQVEGVFNAHPEVYRSALIGVRSKGDIEPVVCIETPRPLGKRDRARVLAELAAMPTPWPIERFTHHPAFPVDIRHNAKIEREALARWVLARQKCATKRELALSTIPIFGWLFIVAGLIFPLHDTWLLRLFCLDVFLSIGVHGAQLTTAISRGTRAGYLKWQSVALTFLLGATWWKRLPAR